MGPVRGGPQGRLFQPRVEAQPEPWVKDAAEKLGKCHRYDLKAWGLRIISRVSLNAIVIVYICRKTKHVPHFNIGTTEFKIIACIFNNYSRFSKRC